MPQSSVTASANFPSQLHAALVLRKRNLSKLLGISLAHIDRLRKKGDFPAPIRLGDQTVGWTLESVQEWLSKRPLVQQ